MPNTPTHTPLERLDTLSHIERRAFLALFATGTRHDIVVFTGADGASRVPCMGKAECEAVPDWLEFYRETLPGLGLTTYSAGPQRPSYGAAPGSSHHNVSIGVTDDGWSAREAWWDRLNRSSEQEGAADAAAL